MKSLLRVPLLVGLSLVFASCSSFETEWNQAVADYNSGATAAPYGPWQGTWKTSTNGHTGDLRAIVKPSPTPGNYKFRYHATWGAFFRGAYEVDFPGKKQGNVYRIEGSKNLGPFGTFGHKATVTASSLSATYSNDEGDLGSFNLKRP